MCVHVHAHAHVHVHLHARLQLHLHLHAHLHLHLCVAVARAVIAANAAAAAAIAAALNYPCPCSTFTNLTPALAWVKLALQSFATMMADLDELIEMGGGDEQEHDVDGRLAQLDELIELGDPQATPEPASPGEDDDPDPTGIDALVEMGASPEVPALKYQRRSWQLLQHARDCKEKASLQAEVEGQQNAVAAMGRALL